MLEPGCQVLDDRVSPCTSECLLLCLQPLDRGFVRILASSFKASLRAELDQLKRAFRQTMAGGVIGRDERPMIVAEALAQVDHLLEMRDRLDMRQSAMAADDLWVDDDANWDIEQ